MRVGLDVSDEDGMMELLKRGHSIMAFDKVLSRMGRLVRWEYCWDSHTSAGVGAGYPADGLTLP